ATDNTSPRSPRSGGLRPPCSGPARPEHRPAATSRRSLQACIASLSLQSSLLSKTYLKSDHFNGGGSSAPSLSRAWVAGRARGQGGVLVRKPCPHLKYSVSQLDGTNVARTEPNTPCPALVSRCWILE